VIAFLTDDERILEEENHWAAIRLWFAYYNLCRVHQTLRVTPAMEAGLATRIWKLADLLS
jgi:hypothetical protein